ncbi:MAG TPA: hypothetical protein VFT59_04050 [Candidatus Saccharimonadales bacterium]|nr:hypothetical protein [Candidatus Saccharimonadales bacterium]
MRKFIIFSCMLGSLAIILDQFGFFEALLMFLVAGAIPGTTYSVPSGIMYGLLIISICLVIVRLISPIFFDFLYIFIEKHTSPKKTSDKELPKRRYGQI